MRFVLAFSLIWSVFSGSLEAWAKGPIVVEAEVSSLKITAEGKAPAELLVSLAKDFPKPLKIQEFASENDAEWVLKIPFLIRAANLSLIYNKKKHAVDAQGKVDVALRLKLGSNKLLVTLVDAWGRTSRYRIQVEIKKIASYPAGGPVSFFVIGPVGYMRFVHRSGSAITETNESSFVLGVKSIYRRQIFKETTDRLEIFRIFFDATAIATYSLSPMSGVPHWIDLRTSFELFSKSKFRLEAGIGGSYYSPLLFQTQTGDLTYFVGMVLSLRANIPFSDSFSLFAGGNITLSLPISNSELNLNSLPLEAFLAASFPIGKRNFLEIRGRFYWVNTTGAIISSGSFARSEMYVGPEVLFIHQF